MIMAEEKKAAPAKAPAKKAKKVEPYKKRRSCPKCGPGIHLAEHEDRLSCGKCGYFEAKKKA